MTDPAPPDPPRPEPGGSLEAYKPYLALFGIATAGVALLVVMGGIALAVFMKAGWVLVPLACAIWTLFPLRDLRDLEAGGWGGLPDWKGGPAFGARSEPAATAAGARGAGTDADRAEGAGPVASGDATGAATAGERDLAGGPGAGASPPRPTVRRRAAWEMVRHRAVNALLITFTAWAALILLHLI